MKQRRRRPARYPLVLGLCSLFASVGWIGWVTGSGCAGSGEPDERRSVVLVVVDTLRVDRVGVYGASRPTTPTLDRLAGMGVRFTRAYAPSPWTKPSLASILSGLYPVGHGARSITEVLPDSVTTVAEILRDHGFATAAVVSGHFATARHGMRQGFQAFDQSTAAGDDVVSSGAVTTRALLLAREAHATGRPYFLLVHYFDPHYRYRDHPSIHFAAPPDGGIEGDEDIHTLRAAIPDLTTDEIERLHALYDEEVRFVDHAIGRLFAGIDQLDQRDQRDQGDEDEGRRTAIIVTADHGEELTERGWIGHTRTLYQELLHVPLIVRGAGPEFAPGSTVESPVSTVAVAATVLELAGVDPAPFGFQAPSLFAPPTHDDTIEVGVIGEVDFRPALPNNTAKTAFKKALIQTRYKLVRDDPTGALELFDLERDPHELDNLATREPERAAAMLRQLESRLADLAIESSPAPELQVDSAELERLRQLGYVDGAPEPTPRR